MLLCCLVGGLTVAGDGRAAAADSNARARADVADVSPKKLPEQAQLSDPQRDGTSAASRESRRLVDHVLAGAKFHRVEKQRLPVFLEDMDSETVARQSTPLPRWLRALIMNFVDVVWWSAWVVVIGIGAWLGYRYRYWIAELAGRPRRQRDREVARGAVIAGVSLGAAATADDSEAQAGALWMRGDQRAALAMLLRLSLVSLVRRHGCVFVHGDTETDCTRRVTAIQPFARADYFQRLIGVWQDVAYAHRLPAVQTFGELLAGYHDAMESLIAVPAAPARAAAAGMQ